MTDHITTPRALLEQALEAFQQITTDGSAKSGEQIVQDISAAEAAIRAELAKPVEPTPAWHDAPTEPGLWMCNEGDDNPYRWTTHRVTFPLNQLLVGEDERWYGPIPQDVMAEGGAA